MTAIASRIGLIAGVLALAACGGSDSSPIGVNNVSPTGSVGGLILDAATMGPIAGVPVIVIAGGKILPSADGAATDAAGRFAIEGVPAGDLIVQIAPKAGYQQVTIEGALANAAGDFPLANSTLSVGPIALIPLSAADAPFKVQLINPDGSPGASVKAHLRTQAAWVDLSTGSPQGRGFAVAEATSDNAGILRFSGIPDFLKIAGIVGAVSDTVQIILPPLDTNKDGLADFFGKEQSFSVTKLSGAMPTIVLSSAAPNAVQVIASNIAALMGKTGNRVLGSTSGPLFVAFNCAIEPKSVEVTLYDELGKPVASAPDKTASGHLLTVTMKGLLGAAEYNINVRVFCNVSGTLLEGVFGAPIFTPAPAGAKLTATLKRSDAKNPNRVSVGFNEPIGLGSGAGPNLTGQNAVLYFDADLNGSGIKGDFPGERGATSTNIQLSIDEAQPPGKAGLSGLSTRWYFELPQDSMGTPIPGGTAFDLLFTRTANVVQRGDGAAVPDLVNLSVPN
jgi:hypothetical protein